ncbi:MAG: hypothetical protein PF487_15045 [Bacteroidales bacterium]|jgi:DNA polymerase III gamma/tau subunit|nr:hypothetical protein [Bacteroidales bacterium]
MKKDSKQRLFEVMGRLDPTFKQELNENFEEIEATDNEEIPAEMGNSEEIPDEMGNGEEQEEKSPEEKLEELTAKVDEIYELLHSNGEEEEMSDELPAEEPEEIGIETGEVNPENLQEWNFDKKKGEKEDKKHKKSETPEDEVEAITKVGK